MAIDVEAARVVEYQRLLDQHVRLLREHASLKRKRFDSAEHDAHKRDLKQHIEELSAFRLCCDT